MLKYNFPVASPGPLLVSPLVAWSVGLLVLRSVIISIGELVLYFGEKFKFLFLPSDYDRYGQVTLRPKK